MTPQEKAEELVSKMLKEVGYDTDLALPCALIAVYEIIQSDPIMPIDIDCPSKSSLKYWREVKQEIENLKTK
jgi:hypothetical protein